MSLKSFNKEAAVAATIIFNQSGDGRDQPSPAFSITYIDVIALNGLAGSPVIPGAGTFVVWVKTDVDGGWKTVGTIAAAEAAGSAGADGAAVGKSFTGSVLELKIVPAGITTATHYRASIKQLSAQ